jgi:aspartyl protease family protein
MQLLRIAALGLVFAAWNLAAFAPAQEKAEDVLKAKGIRRVGTYLALADEAELTKGLATLAVEKLKKAVRDSAAELAVAERRIAEAKDLINTYSQQRREINLKLNNPRLTVEQHNALVTQFNELGERIRQLENLDPAKEFKAPREKANQAREAYLQHVLDMRTLADKIQQAYVDLAADAEVKAAIAELNKETGKTYELVESKTFQAKLRDLKKLEDTVLSESIPLRTDGSNTYQVSTVLNGKYNKELVIDSGASVMCLPHKIAAEVGVEPKSTDPDIVLSLADGREVQAKLVKIPQVRVGKFTVENVECAVMPESLVNASAILGMSFLKNFSFKIDSETNKLTMAKVDTPTSGTPPKNPK